MTEHKLVRTKQNMFFNLWNIVMMRENISSNLGLRVELYKDVRSSESAKFPLLDQN